MIINSQIIVYIFAFLLATSNLECFAQASKSQKSQPANKQADYILFGTYFGECLKSCAIMYRFDLRLKANTLFVDSTDSFLKKNGAVICKSHFVSPIKAELARKLAAKIPNRLMNTSRLEDRFGCPDCADGGGIYIEFSQGARVKRFYIDYDTDKLPPDIRVFAESVLATIEQM